MRNSIRVRFFAWVGLQTALIYFAIGVVLLAFNLHERHEHPDLEAEEAREALVVAGVMALIFPLALGTAWLISRRLLRPWQSMVAQAEHIGAGHLDERIDVLNSGDEVARLAGTLNTTFDRYQHLLDRLHRFSYDVSHQLRNPLAAIRTSGEVCLQQPRTRDEYTEVIGGILEDAGRLNRTVEQLLMLARAAQGALDEEREDIDVREIVSHVIEEARRIGDSRDLDIELDLPDRPLMIRGVPELIRQALTNLIDNALRFSPDQGRVGVDANLDPDGRVRVSVADAGPGLAPERKATLFRPFSREPGAGKDSTGLGLSIVADICRAHNGEVGVEDGRPGCVFWMVFPAAQPCTP